MGLIGHVYVKYKQANLRPGHGEIKKKKKKKTRKVPKNSTISAS